MSWFEIRVVSIGDHRTSPTSHGVWPFWGLTQKARSVGHLVENGIRTDFFETLSEGEQQMYRKVPRIDG